MDVKINNAVSYRFNLLKELKETRNTVIVDLAEDIIKQENKTLERIEKVVSKFGDTVTSDIDFKKLEEELNINLKNMVPLESIVKHDPKHETGMMNYIVRYLLIKNKIEKITVGSTGSEYIICHPPDTDVYIKPYTKDEIGGKFVKEVLAVSEKIADEIINNYNHFIS